LNINIPIRGSVNSSGLRVLRRGLLTRGAYGIHIHQFIADKTDNYLLRITGAYNFTYTIESTHPIDAPSLNAAQIVFSLEPNPASVGKAVTLEGFLTSNEKPIPNETVTIKLNGTPVGNLTTNSTGGFKASGKVESAGTYNITVRYEGSNQYLPSENSTILVVKEATIIYCRVDPTPVGLGNNFTYAGILVNSLSKPISGAPIELYYRTLTEPWIKITTVTTDSYGIFRWQGTALVTGTILLAAYYPGSVTRESNYNYASLVVQ
jgi:hypothetical protein